MRILKHFLYLLISLILLVSLSACNRTSTLDFTCFNTGVRIQVNGKSLSDQTTNKIKNTLYSLESEFSVKNGTFTTALNNSDVNTQLQVSSTASDLLKLSQELYDFTDGYFNPAVYPLVKLWQFSTDYPVLNFTPPNLNTVSAYLSNGYLDFNCIKTQPESLTVFKTMPVEVDFGGILKGYASDVVCKILVDDGYENGYVNIGGSSLTVLASDTLAIRHPENANEIILRVKTDGLNGFSVSTSGTYERFYSYEGKKHSHIINPETGCPADTGITGATVINTDGAFGDAVTTALCLMQFNKEDVENCQLVRFMNKIVSKYPDCMIFVVYDNQTEKFVITNKESEVFTLFDDTYSVINI